MTKVLAVLASFFKVDAREIIKWISISLVVVFTSVAGYFLVKKISSTVTSIAKAQQTIATQQLRIAQLETALTNNEKELKKKEEISNSSMTNLGNLHTTLNTLEQNVRDSDKDTDSKIYEINERYKSITPSEKLTQQREREISNTQIDSLWNLYTTTEPVIGK